MGNIVNIFSGSVGRRGTRHQPRVERESVNAVANSREEVQQREQTCHEELRRSTRHRTYPQQEQSHPSPTDAEVSLYVWHTKGIPS